MIRFFELAEGVAESGRAFHQVALDGGGIGDAPLSSLRVCLRPALSRARLRRVTFHSLRHSCASAMILAGAAITEVQHQLGHTNPSITLGIYSHWFKGAKGNSTAERLAKMVVGISEPRGMWALSGHSEESNSSASATVA